MSVSRNIVHINSSDDEFVSRIRESFQAAMANDPVARYLVRDAAYKRFWDFLIDKYRQQRPSDLNIALEGAEAGILARMYPSEEQATAWSSAWQMLNMMTCGHVSRMLAGASLASKFESGQEAYAKEHGEFLYVFLVGTRPEHQGQGLGSVLLRHISNYADARGLHCYLESSSEGSRRLYMRHGYRQLEEFRMRPDAPPLFLMARPPKERPLAPSPAEHAA